MGRIIARISAILAVFLLAVPVAADDPKALARALAAVEARDWATAGAEAKASGALAEDIVRWHRLRAGDGSFAEYEDFAARRGDWPGMPLLAKKGEAMLAGVAPDRVRAFFAAGAPQTGAGLLAYAAALAAGGDQAAALVQGWRTLAMSAAEQAALLAAHGPVLADHHSGRIAAMLAEGRLDDARRMLDLVPEATRAVALARIALQERSNGVDALIAAVPERMAGSAGLAHDRFIWRIRKDRYDDAATLMLERSDSAENLGQPEAWANWRRILARREMRQGDAGRAYEMAARHRLTSGSDYADLEWLAGYIALRKLGRAEAALEHFRRFRQAVASPISLSRAGYWEGRALEELGRGDEAQAAYRFAAGYQTAFYGLLAAEKAGIGLDPALVGKEKYPDWRQAEFAKASVFQAAVLLRDAGDPEQAERFLLHLAERLGAQDIGALAGLALEWGEARTALRLAKAAADQGVIWPRAYFPLSGLEKLDLPVAPELVLSIARRESEFDPRVISSAGARGLMQVMPGTAKLMAPRISQTYELGRLTSDPEYNARLGAAYLADLVGKFGPSPVLVAAGYNAGPGRPARWMTEMGDPRTASVDVIDWIEHIPYRETQNYVMRVAESLPVYRARLTGKVGPLRLSAELKGQ